MKLKNVLIVGTALMFLLSGSMAFATVEFGDPGWYTRSKTEGGIQYQYFPNGHPEGNSEWTYCGECGDNPSFPQIPTGSSASLSLLGVSYDRDRDRDWSLNDFAKGKAEGCTGAEVDMFADATGGKYKTVWVGGWPWEGGHFERVWVPNEAGVFGTIFADTDAHAWAYTKDYGLSSKAGAGAVVEGKVIAGGLAYGANGLPETVTVNLFFEGNVSQYNKAAEINYPGGQGITAVNESAAHGEAFKTISDFGCRGVEVELGTLDAKLITKGKSEVSIDPYGSNRSMTGYTTNETKISSNGTAFAGMSGAGAVYGGITNGPAIAAGYSGFNYNGVATYGTGNAFLNANILNNGSTVIISGGATSSINGANVPN